VNLADFVGKWHSKETPSAGPRNSRESWLTVAADGAAAWKIRSWVNDREIDTSHQTKYEAMGSQLLSVPTGDELKAAADATSRPFRPEMWDVEWLDAGKTKFQLRSHPDEAARPHLQFERMTE
jgi:hypothetical protein